jgi:hypothetical protein
VTPEPEARPTCPTHFVPLFWQTGWGYPSWECGQCMESSIEGEPYEDTYFPGIADYDRFGRPSWSTEED